MNAKSRRRWTAEEKIKILDEARQTPAGVSGVCRRHGVATGQFYTWEKVARQGALAALRDGKRGCPKSDPTAALQTEIQRLQAVIAELSAENLALKKGGWS
jgi:transposase